MKIAKLLLVIIMVVLVTACTDNNKSLTCKRTFSSNDEQIFKYSFKDGKVYLIDITIKIPNDQIANHSTYEVEFNKINSISGCSGTFTKNNDSSYTTNQVCDLTKMSDSDIKKVFSVERNSLQQTRTEILELYEESDAQNVCE